MQNTMVREGGLGMAAWEKNKKCRFRGKNEKGERKTKLQKNWGKCLKNAFFSVLKKDPQPPAVAGKKCILKMV